MTDKETVKAVHVPMWGEPRVIDLDTSLESQQVLVEGLVDYMDGVYEGLTLVVGDESLIDGHDANRAVWANEHTVRTLRYSQMDGSPLRVGSLYYVVHGPFIVVAEEEGEDGELSYRDMTDAEVARVVEDFRDPDSGHFAMWQYFSLPQLNPCDYM